MAYLERFISTGHPIDGVKRGDLIRSSNTNDHVNLVHKVEMGDKDDVTIYSTRFANYHGGKFRLVHGTRARPFTINNYQHYTAWEIVQHIRSYFVDHKEDINAALNRGFELYVDPDLDPEDEDEDL